MKRFLLATALASVGFATAAHAGSVTIDGLTITQILAEYPGTFNNNPIGSTTGYSGVCNSAYCGTIAFSSDGGVQQGTTGAYAQPAGDGSHYLYGVNFPAAAFGGIYVGGLTGSIVTFNSYQPDSFNIYWGSIDALTTSTGSTRYDNTLTVYGLGDNIIIGSITGSELVAATAEWAAPVQGLGDQLDANDNQWFNISADQSILGFSAYSTNNAFEFDMAVVPEPSTWAMMLLGFAGLGYAALRRSGKDNAAIA